MYAAFRRQMEVTMKKYIMITIFILAIVLSGCSGKENQDTVSGNSQTKEVKDTDMGDTKSTAAGDSKAAEPTTEPTTELTPEPTAEPTPEPTPIPPGLVLPLLTNESGKVLIQTVSKSSTYPYNSYIITSVNGESIVLDPTAMPKKEECNINPAAILSTHTHQDHIDAVFLNSYECEKLAYKKGEIDTEDFHIYTILSSHNGDTIAETNLNVIIVAEVDGLRIAHMGDIGQTALTEEQRKELGEIDIAFMQFENSYSNMSLQNGKGFNLMDQLKPKIIIPTHYGNAALPMLEEKYGVITELENILEISEEDIPEQTAVYRILNKHVYTVPKQ